MLGVGWTEMLVIGIVALIDVRVATATLAPTRVVPNVPNAAVITSAATALLFWMPW